MKYLIILLFLTSCVRTAGVVEVGNQTFTTSAAATPMAGGTFQAYKSALESANKHCADKGLKTLIKSATNVGRIKSCN